uniref:Uncharacterized protein n=1 Tax=Panagrolaimus davidi TaxID=227884 RepID=A0A914Q8M0_9BILA
MFSPTTLFAAALLGTLPLLSLASFCGDSAVPFSFEALPSGQPVLGCARPTCFGWQSDGLPAGSPSSFYRVNRKPDGYFRKSADSPRAIPAADAKSFKSQTAVIGMAYSGRIITYLLTTSKLTTPSSLIDRRFFHTPVCREFPNAVMEDYELKKSGVYEIRTKYTWKLIYIGKTKQEVKCRYRQLLK